ncbi:hypothetical protein [Antricoccus suffuscus]|uniref:hypothetical protein n=1 Tax=Antricoccus suffuscus TaxID=1629062 RepID=UPI000D065EFC|nr:hypothetical protein [Antricoccus suffuscus]
MGGTGRSLAGLLDLPEHVLESLLVLGAGERRGADGDPATSPQSWVFHRTPTHEPDLKEPAGKGIKSPAHGVVCL